VVAALMHDALEDTQVDRTKIGERFGAEVLLMVDGVTKIAAFLRRTKTVAELKASGKCSSHGEGYPRHPD
jgi:GTP pyrophosphokinase